MTLKTRPLLRDIDDVQHYADSLENVFCLLYEEFGELLAKFPLIKTGVGHGVLIATHEELAATYEQLARMRHTMSLLLRDMANRKARLADIATGFSDVIFDEQGPKE